MLLVVGWLPGSLSSGGDACEHLCEDWVAKSQEKGYLCGQGAVFIDVWIIISQR